jgi:hypothetical protein
VSFNATVHHIGRRHFRSQTIYFYRGPTNRGPWTRVKSQRVTISSNGPYGETFLNAKIRYYNRHSGFTWACYRHPLVSDMGRPFLFKACGRTHVS